MRCFIGLPVPAEPGAALGRLPLPARARSVAATDLHLTLAFLGERSGGWARALWPALAGIAAATPAFDLTLPAVDVFPRAGGRVLAALAERDPRLLALHGAVWRVLRDAGVAAETRRFLPHVTLARLPAPTESNPVPGPWTLPVREVMFYQSPPEQDGYRALARWPTGTD
ncbi:RNA 2',3'-cyclic phosphodiesterase [Alloalcanivorax sp. C16-2]|uniref:RNA 2',3'-cyclic phosphodiesterase n=1 Tax=Alloalcanivorax sp. C16-2 TaxID=3390052 RepID=UPI00397090D3